MLTALALATAVVTSPPTFESRPCKAPELAAARCGVVRVPEDRAKPAGRQIDLNVVILPATSARPDLPPLVDIDGGPGLPSTRSAGFYLTDGAGYRARRDVVLVDQRGTGASNPLHCPELSTTPPYEPMYPTEAVIRCRDTLAKTADLTRYTTGDAIADLDAVRAALGHETIDIVALSYGTTVALRYMAAYPTRVRAVVLSGVAPPQARPPRQHAQAAERALALLFGDCAADPACHAAYPSPADDLDKAVARLPTGPGSPSREVFLEKIRSLMYSPATARSIPYILHRAAEGDLEPFRAAAGVNAPSILAEGMYLSVTCAESLALMDYPEAAAASRATRFGDYRLRRQREACAVWPTARVSRDTLAPISSSAAVLLLSGRLDPVTPPEWAAEAASGIPRSRQLMMPASGHVFDGLSGIDSCYDPMLIGFLETADPAAVDASCLAGMTPPPFKVAPPPSGA